VPPRHYCRHYYAITPLQARQRSDIFERCKDAASHITPAWLPSFHCRHYYIFIIIIFIIYALKTLLRHYAIIIVCLLFSPLRYYFFIIFAIFHLLHYAYFRKVFTSLRATVYYASMPFEAAITLMVSLHAPLTTFHPSLSLSTTSSSFHFIHDNIAHLSYHYQTTPFQNYFTSSSFNDQPRTEHFQHHYLPSR